jgi:hypothetical protein
MTAEQFRRLALRLPQVVEAAHMGHPDFRVANKIFATLAPDDSWGVVKLTPGQQAEFASTDPNVFEPCAGAWGRRGYTKICLKRASKELVCDALLSAWRNTAPKRLLQECDEEP